MRGVWGIIISRFSIVLTLNANNERLDFQIIKITNQNVFNIFYSTYYFYTFYLFNLFNFSKTIRQFFNDKTIIFKNIPKLFKRKYICYSLTKKYSFICEINFHYLFLYIINHTRSSFSFKSFNSNLKIQPLLYSIQFKYT